MVKLGIDIGTRSVKVAGITDHFFGRTLLGVAEVPIPEGTLTQHGLSKTNELGIAIRKALSEAKPHPLKSRCVVSAIPANLGLIKLLELPAMERAEIANTIPFEATQAFPVALDELSLDWLVLPTSLSKPKQPKTEKPPEPKKDSKPNLEVLMVAVPKDLVLSLTSFFKNLNFELIGLDLKPLAAIRAISRPTSNEAFILTDIGARETSLTLFDAGIRHIANLSFGGDQLIYQSPGPPPLTQKTENRKQKTEKNERQIINSKSGSSKSKIKKAPNQSISLERLEPLVSEIQHLVRFAEQRLSGRPIRKLMLCGGGAAIPDLAPLLEQSLNFSVSSANPLERLRQSALSQSSLLPFTTAIGLSLWNNDL